MTVRFRFKHTTHLALMAAALTAGAALKAGQVTAAEVPAAPPANNVTAPAASTPATPATTQAITGSAIGLELNKVESYDKGCRFFLVVDNPSDQAYQAFKLDMALFQPDGVIGRQFALDLAPLKAQKKSVKQFDLEGVACDKIGSLFVNDVRECKSDSSASQDCLQRLKPSTLSNVQLLK